MTHQLILPFLVIIFVSLPATGTPATWYVDVSVAESGDGSSWEQALNTIQAARDVANDDDVIILAPGSYSDPRGTISFGKALTLRSSDPNDPEVISTTILEDTAIRAQSTQGSFAIRGMTIRGGGLSLACRSVTVTQNVILGSPSRNSLGIDVSTLQGLVRGNVIADHNRGGISCSISSLTIENNVIVHNSTSEYGAAIRCQKSSVSILNNTIVANSARLGPGGIFCNHDSDARVVNCILYGNGDDLYNCQATYSCVEDGDPGEGNVNYYPHFVDRANGDYHLSSWSPCIDAGDPTSPFSLEREPNGGRVNLGAYGNTLEAASRSADAGADGLPDDWEITRFGHLDYNGEDDPDGDRILNLAEYLFGWDPTSPATSLVENVTRGRWYQAIQPAIFDAHDADEVVVFPGTYHESINFMGKALTLRSADPFDPATVASTVIEGDTGDVVSFTAAESRRSVLCGLKLRHPRGIFGRAILCKASSPTISHTVIGPNTIGDWPGAPEAERGAGIYICGGSPLIQYNTIENNSGAAIHCELGEPLIRWNTITENFGHSGALSLEYCPLGVIEGNTITNNSGSPRGGLFIHFSHVYAINNLVALNYPAGICSSNATGLVLNCTIMRNEPEGITCGHSPGALVVSNCILWENGDDLAGPKAVNSCIQDDDPGEGNIHVDPGFVSPDKGDFRLGPNSPCINAGNTAAVLDVTISPSAEGLVLSWSSGNDLDANPRISGNAVDMGAYEYQEGAPNLNFIIEYSSDLVSWECVEVGSAWEWIDEALDGVAARFYRIGVR